MTASRAGRDRQDGDLPNASRTDSTPAVEIREDGDSTNALVETDDAALLVAWDSGEVDVDELLDLLDDCERELRHQVRITRANGER